MCSKVCVVKFSLVEFGLPNSGDSLRYAAGGYEQERHCGVGRCLCQAVWGVACLVQGWGLGSKVTKSAGCCLCQAVWGVACLV